jgi:hypothetical protein
MDFRGLCVRWANYILKHYHLQAKDWISYSSAPTKIKNHFELAVKFDKPNKNVYHVLESGFINTEEHQGLGKSN